MYGENKLIAAIDGALPALQGLTGNVSSLIEKMRSEKDSLGEINTLERALSFVSDTLQAVEVALDIIDVIPEIGEVSGGFSESVTLIASQVSEASNTLEGVSVQVETVVAALENTISGLTNSLNNIGLEQQSLQSIPPRLSALIETANNLPNGIHKDQLLRQIEGFSDSAANFLSQFDVQIANAGSRADDDKGKLTSSHLVSQIQGAIDGFNHDFGFSAGQITQLMKALQSITITLWVPGYGDQTVTLYQVFEQFEGVEDAIEQAMQPIDALVGDVNSVLQQEIPQIPLLGQIENLFVPQDWGFNQLQSDLVMISQGLMEITTGFNQLAGPPPGDSP